MFQGVSASEVAAGDRDEFAVVSPFDLGRTYELLLAPATRRKTGSHLTPERVARQLVALIPDMGVDATVLDPAVGGAAFLLAAADRLVAAGAQPQGVYGRLRGIDIDPTAVEVAEAALGLWALDNGLEPQPLASLSAGDGLLLDLAATDVVVGNPPFLNQLRASSTNSADRRAALRARWGDLFAAYTDDAWLFLAAGVAALTPGGSLAMVQPVSILAARHAQAVRAMVGDTGELSALWVARDRVFDAAVQVCGIVIERPADAASVPVTTRRFVGADFAPCEAAADRVGPEHWGSAAAATMGVPEVKLATSERTVGDLASATAGFRDQFYGFVPYVHEQVVPASSDPNDARPDDVDPDDVGPDEAHPLEEPPLVTVGMIDPLTLSWGHREFKFAKQPYTRPVLDLVALRAGDPSLGEWVSARLRPKLLVATQTRVIEVWVDEKGRAVPATPVLSVEPFDEESLWLLAAALSSPAITARMSGEKFGTAMSIGAMKLAARDVHAVPLPAHSEPWHQAAELIRDSADRSFAWFESFARLMGEAYGVDDGDLVHWWLGRLPNRSKNAEALP